MVPEIVEKLIQNLESIGVYVVPGMVALSVNALSEELVDDPNVSLKQLIEMGEASVIIQLVASTGDLALSDDFLFPEKAKEKAEFLSIAPLETEIKISQMFEEYEQMMNEDDEDL